MSKVLARLTFALIFLVGIFLRLTQLKSQVLWGDELFSLRAALRYGFPEILTHFGGADYCIPLTFLNRLLLLTGGMSEWALRLPPLLFGMASLVVFTLLVRGALGWATALLFSWFLAISPFHVSMSRFARPYPISLFLAFTALFAAYRFHVAKDRRMAWIYVPCAILAPYFHLSTLLVALAPPLLLLLPQLGGKSSRREQILLLKLVFPAAIGLALLLLPPIWGDHAALTHKALRARLEWQTFVDAASLLFGVRFGGAVSIVMLALTALGIREGLRRSTLCGFLITIVTLQFFFTLLTQPVGMEVGLVLARFNLICLPVILILISLGIERAAIWTGQALRMPIYGVNLALCGVLSVFLLGPLASASGRTNGWIAFDIWRQFIWSDSPSGPPRFLKSDHVADFYRTLALLPSGSVTIVEVPWHRAGPIPHSRRQLIHGQKVVIGLLGPLSPLGLLEPGARSPDGPTRYDDGLNPVLKGFQNFVHLSEAGALRDRGAKYVVFHRDLEGELDPGHDPGENVTVEPWVTLYEKRYGPPTYRDEELVVFDVSAGPVNQED